MTRFSKCLSVFLGTALLSAASLSAADEFKAFPIFTDKNWKANIEVAAVAAHVNFDRSEVKDGMAYGLDLSFDCPVFTLPGDHLLRQQLTLSRYEKNGLKVTTIEMNPYYFVDLSKDLVLGFGPGIGGVHADVEGGESQWLFAVQAGAGLKYYIDDFLIGLDLRYQWTAEKELGELDNTRLLLKAGYRF
jgi:opacity protein-like surface antigen